MSESKIERILHAAVKAENGMILLGKCHADCFHQGYNLGLNMSKDPDDQGFMTNTGKYVNRIQAATIAVNACQVSHGIATLFSEFLWCERDGGSYHYDSIKGYYL